jgi:hypothetical protein
MEIDHGLAAFKGEGLDGRANEAGYSKKQKRAFD